MAAGPGFLDPQGIWRYGEDDADTLFSDFLDLGQESVSAAFAADRQRLTLLEDDWAEDIITQFGAGWSATNSGAHRPRIRSIGKLCLLYGAVTAAAGASASYLVAVPGPYRPTITTGTRFLGTTVTSANEIANLSISGTGIVAAVYGNFTPAAGDVVPLVAQWWRD